jgi:preprotein translocase subunit SecD
MKPIVTYLALAVILLSVNCKPVSRMFNSGGTMFVVDVLADGKAEDVIERVVMITQSRLDAVGIDGEVKRFDDRRIEVRVFGKHDLEPIRKFLFTNYKLELKKVVSPPSPSPVRQFPSHAEAEAALGDGQQVLPYMEIDGGSSSFVIVEKDPIVTGEHIRSAQAISYTGSDLDYQISFSLNTEGAAKFGNWTASNINNYLAVVLNGKVQSIAYIKTQISDMGEITGRFSKAEAEEIAASLSSGKMPAELKVIEEKPF